MQGQRFLAPVGLRNPRQACRPGGILRPTAHFSTHQYCEISNDPIVHEIGPI